MKIKDIDHLTIIANDLNQMMRFYHEVFDLPVIKESDEVLELQLGHQKLIFTKQAPVNPKNNIAGSANFCIITKDSLKDVTNHLANYGVEIVKGPIETRGANGMMNAVFVNDPDGNVIEVCEYVR